MMKLLKDHYALLAGLLLPLVLIAVFFVVGEARVSRVPDPQHGAVFATNYTAHAGNYRYRIRLDNGKLYIRVRPPPDGKAPRYQREPQIYVFDPATRHARKIDIDFENVVDGRVVDPDLDQLNQYQISNSAVSPDGYKFEYRRRGGGGLLTGIFGSRRRNRSNYALVKDGRSVPVVGPEPIWSAHFIGWMEK